MPRKGRYSGGYTIVCIPRALHEQLQKVEMHVSVLVAALIEDYLKRIPMEIEKIQEEAAREKWSSLQIASEIHKRVFFEDISKSLRGKYSGGYTAIPIPIVLYKQLQKVAEAGGTHVATLVIALIEDYLRRIPLEIEKIQEEAAREKWSSLRIAIEINKRVFFKDLSGLLKSLFHKDIPELISK
jgi:hydrogenase maturation factor